MTLRASGFTLDELGALPLKSWVDLYGATRAQYWDDKATDVAVMHPAVPKAVQRGFVRQAMKSWGAGSRPIWADVKKFKSWLMGQGALVREGDQTKT